MNAATLSGKSVAPAVVRTTPGTDNGCRSHARGLDALRWIGLVADGLPADRNDLDLPFLAGGHCSEDPAHWLA